MAKQKKPQSSALHSAAAGPSPAHHQPPSAAPENGPVRDLPHLGATRKNNPTAGGAVKHKVEKLPAVPFSYNPHRPPVLRFDETGKADRVAEHIATRIDKATREPLTAEEAATLREAMRVYEPWLEWAGKRERPTFKVEPVPLHIHERISAKAIW